MDFDKWWADVGSAARPLPSEDTEEHVKRLTAMAWAEADKRAKGLEYAIQEALEQWDNNAHNDVRYTLLGALE